MSDIRDIVGQTSALEKIPAIDLRSQELRAAKLAMEHNDQNIVKREQVDDMKKTDSKNISEEQEHEKYHHEAKKREPSEKEEEGEAPKKVDILEVDEGKIIDIKV